MTKSEQNPELHFDWIDEMVQDNLELEALPLPSYDDPTISFEHAKKLRLDKSVWLSRLPEVEEVIDLTILEADDFVAAHEPEFETEDATSRNLRLARARFANKTDTNGWREVLGANIADELAAERAVVPEAPTEEPILTVDLPVEQPGRLKRFIDKIANYKSERTSRTRMAIAAVALSAVAVFVPSSSSQQVMTPVPIAAAPAFDAQAPVSVNELRLPIPADRTIESMPVISAEQRAAQEQEVADFLRMVSLVDQGYSEAEVTEILDFAVYSKSLESNV